VYYIAVDTGRHGVAAVDRYRWGNVVVKSFHSIGNDNNPDGDIVVWEAPNEYTLYTQCDRLASGLIGYRLGDTPELAVENFRSQFVI
jgi:hypothetical protein